MVFIDFGLSRFIEESQGERTFTNYVGSINYWSPEMHQSFVSKRKIKVDLFYNDLYCLE